MEKNFWGPQKFFSAILSQSHIRTPGPTKADKTLRGPKSFFLRIFPCHIFEPLVPQKPTKLSGAPKVLLRTHTLGQTPTSQPDLPALIISYFNLNSPEVSFRITKLRLRPRNYYNLTIIGISMPCKWPRPCRCEQLSGANMLESCPLWDPLWSLQVFFEASPLENFFSFQPLLHWWPHCLLLCSKGHLAPPGLVLKSKAFHLAVGTPLQKLRRFPGLKSPTCGPQESCF